MGKKSTLYLETTVPSYLAARPSRDIIIAGNQQTTHQWWSEERDQYQIYISQTVLLEAKAGDSVVASIRSKYLDEIPVLQYTADIQTLSNIYLSVLDIPPKSALDAVHLAYAVVYSMDYFLTWNCKHLAHGEVRKKLKKYNYSKDLDTPEIVTPNELMRRTDE